MPIAADIYYYLSKLGGSDRLPVVLIHGAGGTHLNWPPEVRRLPNLRVYSVDLPGHGKSGQRGLQSIQDYTTSLLTWLEAIGLHRAVFIGHSMGGAIALTMARYHAEHVLGLGLVASGARLRVDPRLLENVANSQTFPTAIAMLTAASFGPQANPRLVELAGKRFSETRPSVLQGDLIACDGFNLMESLGAIRTPTLVIGSENDNLTPLRDAQFLSDQIPGAKLKVVTGAGHMVMLEQPQAVAEILIQFLSSITFHPGAV